MTPKRVALFLVLGYVSLACLLGLLGGAYFMGHYDEANYQAYLVQAHSKPTLETTMDSYVRVVTPGGEGSGTEGVFEGRVYVLTAAHVVAGETSIEVRRGDWTRSAAVIGEDKRRDLALLWVRGPREHRLLPSLVPACQLVKGEEAVYTSNGAGLDGYVERSLIAKVNHNPHPNISREIPGCPLVTLVTGKGFYGSSGCGVFVKRKEGYRLAGVISHWAANAPGAIPLAAISPDDIRTFLHDATH